MNTSRFASRAYECLIKIARLFHPQRRDARFIVLLGGPGAGKGTIASKLGPYLGLRDVSTGKLIRREIAEQTPIGRVWGPQIAKGALLPDRVAFQLLKRELSKPEYARGAILDGFPRTEHQARMLRRMLACWGNRVDFVLALEVSREDLIERLSFRRTCTNNDCARTYHLKFSPPRVPDRCDRCGSPIVQRSDETPEALVERMRQFAATFVPLRNFYSKLGNLVVIRSTNAGGADKAFEDVLFALDEHQQAPDSH